MVTQEYPPEGTPNPAHGQGSGRPHIAKSAQNNEVETPPELFLGLDEAYGPFTLDAASARGQFTAELILSRGGRILTQPPPGVERGSVDSERPCVMYDAFEHPWKGKVFLNPPYGPIAILTEFLRKATQEVEYGNAELVVALLPSRTSTKWWQEYVCKAATFRALGEARHPMLEVLRFLPGRVTFVGAKNGAPFASVVVVWRRP